MFKVVELQERVGFQEAVRHLAGRFSIPVPGVQDSEPRESAAEREALVKIHERPDAGDRRSTADRLARCR